MSLYSFSWDILHYDLITPLQGFVGKCVYDNEAFDDGDGDYSYAVIVLQTSGELWGRWESSEDNAMKEFREWESNMKYDSLDGAASLAYVEAFYTDQFSVLSTVYTNSQGLFDDDSMSNLLKVNNSEPCPPGYYL